MEILVRQFTKNQWFLRGWRDLLGKVLKSVRIPTSLLIELRT